MTFFSYRFKSNMILVIQNGVYKTCCSLSLMFQFLPTRISIINSLVKFLFSFFTEHTLPRLTYFKQTIAHIFRTFILQNRMINTFNCFHGPPTPILSVLAK